MRISTTLSGVAIALSFFGVGAASKLWAEGDAAGDAEATVPTTYCNPVDIDYAYCPIPNFVRNGKHRTTADPVIVTFRGDYYLFSTNQWGYWWSEDMARWNFVPRKFLKPHHKVYDELCAPAAFVMDDALYLIGSTYTDDFALYKSTDPRSGEWSVAVENFRGGPKGVWDPALFLDDDGRLYLYHGSSNAHPLYGREVDRGALQPAADVTELIRLRDDLHGWERFGEANDNTFLRPFIEGAWMTKHAGRYYLQYSAPGTEFSGYADGVYIGDKPLGPFEYQRHNPFAYKPGGFARGAGHGATFQDPFGRWWHTSSIAVGVKNNFERRIGIWPAGFDGDGVMFCDTAFGDYPHYLPSRGADRPTFAGWMLLNYAKPTRVSSTLGGLSANFAVDENIRTYWSAATGGPGEWIESDLGAVCEVRGVQINYADQDAELMGKLAGLEHRYRLLASVDGVRWELLVDRAEAGRDSPHAYIELASPTAARFLRLENVQVPTGKFALSGLRVFGRGAGEPPPAVEEFVALRGDSERRNAWLKWRAVPEATGYLVRAGIKPDKLYTAVTVHAANEYYFRAMTADQAYYFRIEAFNENGLSPPSPVALAK